MSEKDIKQQIEIANKMVVDKMLSAQPVWIGIKAAKDVVPGMKTNMILHAGPPIEWHRMCEVQKNGILGGIIHEGLADSEDEAVKLVEKGEVEMMPALDHNVVGAGVGIVTASMMVNICQDKKTKKEGYCVPFEGRVGLSCWGVYSEEVEKNLQVIENILGPSLNKVLNDCGGLDIKSIIAKGIQMNDETHTRQVAEGLILVNEIMPHLIRADLDKSVLVQCVDILTTVERWFHPLGMASVMSVLKGISKIEHSTIVTMMAGNSVDVGIKVSGLGDEWFVAQAPHLQGKYLTSKWSQKDAIPWLGDSCVMETFGLGGFAAAAAPVVIQLRGGSVEDAIQQTEEMRAICVGENNNFPIPLLDFKGPPIGIDIRKVLETGIMPISHGGIISKQGGQIGAGSARFPMECFKKAFYAFAEKYSLI